MTPATPQRLRERRTERPALVAKNIALEERAQASRDFWKYEKERLALNVNPYQHLPLRVPKALGFWEGFFDRISSFKGIDAP